MAHRISFDYNIGDEVNIIDLRLKGRITGLCSDINGKQYRTVYYCDGSRRNEWLFSFEIEPWKERTTK